MNHDASAIQYFTAWLAHIIQAPGSPGKPGTAIVLVSKEGAGKNIFFNELAEIISHDYYFETANLEQDLLGQFCNGRKNKLLIDIDEVNSKQTFANSDMWKNMITSDFVY